MKKRKVLIPLLAISFFTHAQVILIGHNMINNTPVPNTRITVKSGGAVTQTLSTGPRTDFKLSLPFGRSYQVYFQNARSPLMFLEIDALNVPKDKYEYMMTYELNVPLSDKRDEDIDTLKYQKPFARVLYNGRTRMAEDTVYNSAFSNDLIRRNNGRNNEFITAGRFRIKELLEPGRHLRISLGTASGGSEKTGHTDRHGFFVFTQTDPQAVERISLEWTGDSSAGGLTIQLLDMRGNVLAERKAVKGKVEFSGSEAQLAKLADPLYSNTIGGKLVASSMREKKFFAGKTVYLCNSYNTVLEKTKTSAFGTFAFENIKPDKLYYISVARQDVAPGERIDLLTKNDRLISVLDTMTAGRVSLRVVSNYNSRYDQLSLGDEDLKMDIRATIFGDNVNNPIGNLKVVLLNDNYEVLDSVITDNFGSFKFKYLPFLKRFYLSAENTDNMLDVFKNILIYSSEANLVKIMTHQKGTKFTYKPMNTEMAVLRDIEIEDPWLELVGDEPKNAATEASKMFVKGASRLIVENILFENNKSEISADAKQILDKVILVLDHNKNLKIEVGAHTDSKGSATANLKLSESRARMVQEYIISAGISSSRIQSKGYGESRLLNHCKDNVECSETEHARNRRIEFKILGEQATNQ